MSLLDPLWPEIIKMKIASVLIPGSIACGIAAPETRVVKGIFLSRDWLISVCVKCEILDFDAAKCDMFYDSTHVLSVIASS